MFDILCCLSDFFQPDFIHRIGYVWQQFRMFFYNGLPPITFIETYYIGYYVKRKYSVRHLLFDFT